MAKRDTRQARALNRRLEFVFHRGEALATGAGTTGRDRELRDAAGQAAGSLAP